MGGGESILVIKLSALGDFVLAFGPFQAIRAAHPTARIVLLTTKPYADLAVKSPWFDDVWIDDRPKFWQVGALLKLRRKLRGGGFKRVYDLQTSDRSAFYLRLMGGVRAVEWNGHVPGCSHPQTNPARNAMHTVERQKDQLRIAGIVDVPPPDLEWLAADVSHFAVRDPFVLLVPGGAPHRPDKRWPAQNYASLAQELVTQGMTPVVLGTAAEASEAEIVVRACPQTVSLVGKTSIAEVAALARRAAGAVGNDTGPMHLIATAGCPSVALYSRASDPALCGQRGPRVRILRRESLNALAVGDVLEALVESRR